MSTVKTLNSNIPNGIHRGNVPFSTGFGSMGAGVGFSPMPAQFGFEYFPFTTVPIGPDGTNGLSYPSNIDVDKYHNILRFSHAVGNGYQDYNGTKTEDFWDILDDVYSGINPTSGQREYWHVQITF